MDMSRAKRIRSQYWNNEIGFQFAWYQLVAMGFTDFAAEKFLYFE